MLPGSLKQVLSDYLKTVKRSTSRICGVDMDRSTSPTLWQENTPAPQWNGAGSMFSRAGAFDRSALGSPPAASSS
jgi:hypothetical protein